MPDREMFRNNTFVFDVQVFAPPPPGSPPDSQGPPQNITGWKMWFTAKYQVQDPDMFAVSQLTNGMGGGIVFTQPVLGKAEITMPAIATRDFADGDVVLVYDVQVMDTIGRVTTVETGTLTVHPHATRAFT